MMVNQLAAIVKITPAQTKVKKEEDATMWEDAKNIAVTGLAIAVKKAILK